MALMDSREENLSRAVSASSRRKILRLLVGQELTVKEIAAKNGQSISLTSRHLTFLHDLGFLHSAKRFPHKFYSLKNRELASLLELYDQVIAKNYDSHNEEKLVRGISASSRRQLLRSLISKEKTVKELAQETNQSVSLTSRHLTLLHDLGFLQVRKEFPHKYYSLKIKELIPLLQVYDLVIKKI